MSGEEKRARGMSRREFVCLGAGVALGGALGGAATYLLAPRKEPEEERTFNGRGATEACMHGRSFMGSKFCYIMRENR